MGETFKIGIADMATCNPPDKVTTLGLGSCVGIVLYDPVSKKCGMVHVMLPDSTKIRNNSNIAKFADTGIKELYNRVIASGANKARLVAKIAGGATMFSGNNVEMLKIGDRNVEATKKALKELGIRIIAEDTGKDYGRTILFDPETAELTIKAVRREPMVI